MAASRMRWCSERKRCPNRNNEPTQAQATRRLSLRIHANAGRRGSRAIEAPPPRITLKPDSDLDADDQYFDLDQTWTNPAAQTLTNPRRFEPVKNPLASVLQDAS